MGSVNLLMRVVPPAPLASAHELGNFDCGHPSLNDWLRKRALKNQGIGASRTYVVCEGDKVVGFYCLAAGAILHDAAPSKIRRNMPEPVPVMVLGRLGVDTRWHGKGIGTGLLKDAVFRSIQAAEIASIRALLVHAKDEQASEFYRKFGFFSSPIDPMTLMVTLADIQATLG